ncbi:MAG: hypothetical protein A2830_00365 [Candidatus Taylorbacteria bacterium RIFCSPHIGHO2_01_FULL_44_110]|uniref:Uncharacterized protein n=1 Tax=Candidatus Taylorbacteria bacterium RIFCSPHIGHO2_12_FULL_45_16 TaxID=1802315 RepID=A0A1G2N0V6_9BACT|nr:MAG: hypothetical protein A2830_00365 [Candidatus Taylorbacteria bacterium RIFCSPHIGHO2_01_FULL_44_110]OHA28841.1 MAG: hypothetical protein A3F51_02590 [Candidatus Taylorbacteria bacterium RIFCSPHIGHO2_12_FULL_45_16]OHA32900.1 MAG: hypothetical protein A3A23_03390 [Candidatus Taylorbacteria bacterium RIFCSPLOWO2_01_FULL_45_59]OHA39778.1 MAG: hypothetical protein A3I98_03400 [Candidatus Taylorbacteria bacterium RIFCSPLOWO2_02_FULL_45_10b]OHA45203.1 MAG: hypothetical protein A3G04_02320 [Candi
MDANKKLILQLKKLRATEADGWDHVRNNSCCPGDDWADGYNQAIKDAVKLIGSAGKQLE